MSDITQTTEYNMDIANFPALGSVPTKSNGRDHPSPKGRCSQRQHGKYHGKGRGKEVFMAIKNDRQTRDFRPLSVLDLGFKSRIAELREQNQRRYRFKGRNHRSHSSRFNKEEEKARTRAYEKLQNKEGMAERLNKTKFCWSVKQGRQCPHGKEKCKFAHSFDELRIAPCLFGGMCRFVYKEGSRYTNQSQGKTCSYLHPEESRVNYLERTGMDKIKLQEPVVIEPEPVTRLVPVQVIKKFRAEINYDEVKPVYTNDAISHDTYIVPRKLAMETFKMALERGESCIEVRISK